MERRDFIKISSVSPFIVKSSLADPLSVNPTTIQHSICRWCYNFVTLDQLVKEAKKLSIQSIELLNVDEWDIVLKQGLQCAVSNGSTLGITRGFNNKRYHEQLYSEIRTIIPLAAEKGIPNIICFSGNREGISDEEGLENCAQGLRPLAKMAEKYGVNLIMELLNSKVDHHDYQCDRTTWGVRLVEKVDSPNFKLLYDIYHMQIMEGDIISTIRKYKDYIGHYHTGGVPGRNEIDETQELNYGAICTAIKETNYVGFIAQEFIPTWEKPFKALSKAIDICKT